MPKSRKSSRKLTNKKKLRKTINKKKNQLYKFDASKIHPASIVL